MRFSLLFLFNTLREFQSKIEATENSLFSLSCYLQPNQIELQVVAVKLKIAKHSKVTTSAPEKNQQKQTKVIFNCTFENSIVLSTTTHHGVDACARCWMFISMFNGPFDKPL
jgi:hypothetical protein